MGRYGHSEERPIFKPLFAMTNSQFVSKNYPYSIHPKLSFVNAFCTLSTLPHGPPHHIGKMAKKE